MSFLPKRPNPNPAPAPRSRFSRIRRSKETPLTVQFQRAKDDSNQTKYFLISDSSDMSNTANHKTLLRSVGITVVATIVAFAVASSMAFTQYRTDNHLPSQVYHGLFGDYAGPAEVSYSMLGPWVKAGLIAVAVLYPILHALLGRAVYSALFRLCVLSDQVFLPSGTSSISKWSAETKMLVGALWPISMLLLPFLAIGVVLGALYRRLWMEPARR